MEPVQRVPFPSLVSVSCKHLVQKTTAKCVKIGETLGVQLSVPLKALTDVAAAGQIYVPAERLSVVVLVELDVVAHIWVCGAGRCGPGRRKAVFLKSVPTPTRATSAHHEASACEMN